jgi:arsenate reductase (thioredoxin)
LRFFKSKESNQQHKQIVLFVCIENAGRSQIAEGFFKMHTLDGYDAISAGTRPVGMVNPVAIEVMREVGIDISNQRPKILNNCTSFISLNYQIYGLLAYPSKPLC